MLPKVAMTTTLGESSLNNDASIVEVLEDLQIVTIGQLREIVDQINMGQVVFNEKLKDIGKAKVKLLEIKWFNGIQMELKGYLTQILLKLRYKGYRITTPLDAIVYIGIYLIGRALKWFKLYLMEYQTNRLTITNLEIKYIFVNQENFKN